MRKLALALAFGLAATIGQSAAQAAVELDLLLLVDVSGSVDNAEYLLQRNGYVNAFQDPAIHAAIAQKPDGIAVAYAEWSGATQQSVRVAWTKITNATESNAFAAAIAATTRAFSGNTAIQTAMQWGAVSVGQSPFGDANTRWVIDVSGDGERNEGLTGTAGRDAAIAAGVDTINGLAIGGGASLANYYTNNVIAGGGVLFAATNFDDFERAVFEKIGFEIIGGPIVPEAASLIIWGCLLGLVGLRRSRPAAAA